MSSFLQSVEKGSLLHEFVASMPLPTVLLEPSGLVLAVSRAIDYGSLPPGTRPGADLTELVGAAAQQLRRRLSRAVHSTAPVCLSLPTATQMHPFRLWAFRAGSRTLLVLQADPETDSLTDRLELKQVARKLESSLRNSECERKRIAEEAMRLQFAATRDGKTGLLNSVAFENRVTEALGAPGTRGALVYVDLNGFKSVNDTHGHRAGDEVLRAVAQRLQAGTRETDFVARLGGDEFALWLDLSPEVPDNQVTGRLAAAVAAPIALTGPAAPMVHVTAAIGIARAPSDGTTLTRLMECADARMYQDKTGHASRKGVLPA